MRIPLFVTVIMSLLAAFGHAGPLRGSTTESSAGAPATQTPVPGHAEGKLQGGNAEANKMESPPKRPSAERVARRALVLSLVAYRASLEPFPGDAKYEALHRRLPEWVERLGLASELEKKEHDFLRLPLGKADEKVQVSASWREEGLGVLAWALRRYELPPYDQQVDAQKAGEAVGFSEPLLSAMDTAAAQKLLRAAELRPAPEIDRFASHITIVHWRLLQFRLGGEAMDFAAYLRAHLGFNERWLSGLRLVKGDLAIGHKAIADVPRGEAGNCESIAVERQIAAYWLQGDEPIYSQVDAPTLLSVLADEAKAADARRALRKELGGTAAAPYDEGLAHSEKGEHQMAIAKYTEAIQADPDLSQAYFARATAYANTGQHDKAIADFSAAIRLDPQEARAYSGRGNAYAEKKEYPKAIADYTEAIRIQPEQAAFYMMRALTYDDMGKLDPAIADLDQAIRVEPGNASAYELRAKYYRKRGDNAKAGADERKVQELHRRADAAKAYNRGFAYAQKGDLDKAIADYTEAIRLLPGWGEAYCNRGVAHKMKGEIDKAIADYTEAIRFYPEDALAYFNRGLAYEKKGEKSKAEADFARAKKLGYEPKQP